MFTFAVVADSIAPQLGLFGISFLRHCIQFCRNDPKAEHRYRDAEPDPVLRERLLSDHCRFRHPRHRKAHQARLGLDSRGGLGRCGCPPNPGSNGEY